MAHLEADSAAGNEDVSKTVSAAGDVADTGRRPAFDVLKVLLVRPAMMTSARSTARVPGEPGNAHRSGNCSQVPDPIRRSSPHDNSRLFGCFPLREWLVTRRVPMANSQRRVRVSKQRTSVGVGFTTGMRTNTVLRQIPVVEEVPAESAYE